MSPRPDTARLLRLAAPFACIAALSCGDSKAPVSPRPAQPAAPLTQGSREVVASLSDATLMLRTPTAERGARGGTSVDVDAVLLKKNGKIKEKDEKIGWSSSDTIVATVDANGVITAQALGAAIVIADYKDRTADTVSIAVIAVPVASVLVAGLDSISLDDSTQYTATALDSVGVALDGRTVVWTTSAPAIASMSSSGEVIGVGVGSADISATIDGTLGTKALRVWPQPVVSLTVAPASVSVPQFHKVQFTAIARDKRGKVLTDRDVTWSSADPAIFYIKSNADTAAAKDVGTTSVVASVEGVTGSADVTVTNPVEARALWVTRFEYTGPSSVDFAKIATIFQKAASANFNVVYFQARTSGDALYFSDIEPCSPRMCGSLGGTRPAQDPLDVALAEAAKYGIQVHAWLNAYTGFISGSTTACNQFINSTPMNWLKEHPEWSVSTKNFTTGVLTRQVDNCLGTSEYMWISPGVPEVRTRLAHVAADIARRYGPKGLKGIHLDRIRFPSNQVSYDAPSQEAFRAATGAYPSSNAQASWLDFRRGFVNKGVKEVYDSVRAIDASFVLSAAVFPGYKSRTGWSATWSYTDLFQDPQAWAQEGYLDVEVPMNYPATAASASWTVKAYCSNTDWTCVLDDHMQRIERQAGRHVYVGVAGIKGWDEMSRQIALAHDRTATGVSVYSYSLVDAIPNGWAQLAAGPFRHKAVLPAMSWK